VAKTIGQTKEEQIGADRRKSKITKKVLLCNNRVGRTGLHV
jgi:hypothetical protein